MAKTNMTQNLLFLPWPLGALGPRCLQLPGIPGDPSLGFSLLKTAATNGTWARFSPALLGHGIGMVISIPDLLTPQLMNVFFF